MLTGVLDEKHKSEPGHQTRATRVPTRIHLKIQLAHQDSFISQMKYGWEIY
ncbi:rCG56445 [Rattus norvegicus]|uniref:RCG56445 n=1 Tax=Rattus norvegicus TaxID=10116 RepID=A6IBI9_RAT|nr:rCG56445 [Rattus norvegicus]